MIITKSKTVIIIIAIVVGVVVVVTQLNREAVDNMTQESPGIKSSSPLPTASALRSPQPTSKANSYNKLPPAECKLGGQLVFLSPTLSRSEDAAITYRNIDSPARHILWSIEPKADFSVGPNLFARLPLPDGKEDVTINIGSGPHASKYTLSAQVTYGVFNENINLEIKTAKCSGNINIDLSQI